MRLLLLHGAGIASSRKKLTDLKRDFEINDVIVLGEDARVEDIQNNLSATSLFSEKRLIVSENPPEDFTNYQLPTTNYRLILWFDHEVSEKKSVISWVKNLRGEILYFPESKEVSVFPLLDKLGTKEKGAYLEMDKLKKAGYDCQYIIIMIFYLLRNLIVTPKMARDFVKNKNARMRKNFTPEKLVNLYKYVLETDFKIKNGLIESNQAEFLLVNKFIS